MPPIVLLVAGGAEASHDDFVRACERRGLETVRAGTGTEAKARLRRSPPDVIVVWDPLPDTGALRWIESLRASGCLLPVVCRSAEALDPAVFCRLTLDLSVRLVLGEPPEPALLADHVASLVARADPGRGSPPPSFALEMAALRAEYARVLPAKLEELEQAQRLARDRPGDLDLLRQVKALAHGLGGTAGTFGFTGVSATARRIEQAAQRRLLDPASGSDGVFDEIDQALSAARASLAAGARHEG